MSNAELIIDALGAGLAAGVTGTASAAVKDAYAELKTTLRPWVRGTARQALEADVVDTDLGSELSASGADEDEQVVALARRLLELADPHAAPKYRVDVQGEGIQVGDHGTQYNYFQAPADRGSAGRPASPPERPLR